jgi:tetratricopeptide (TPR) repeat protein
VPGWLAWWPGLADLKAKAQLGKNFFTDPAHREAQDALLDRRLKAAPHDPDLLVLAATRHLARNEVEQVRAPAAAATQAAPANAEGWYLLGWDRELAGETAAAIPYYQKAADLAKSSPQYRNNLARALLETGQVAAALQEYRQIDRFPLARLEQGLGYWAQGCWREAIDARVDALRMLDEAPLMEVYYNRRDWRFFLPDQGVRLAALADKRCYAQLGEAAARRLAGETADFPPKDCDRPPVEIARLVADDLCRFVDGYQPGRRQVTRALRRALRQPETCPRILPPQTGAPDTH